MHEATVRLMRYFDCDHLPPNLQGVSRPFLNLANTLVGMGPVIKDGPELTVALRKLLEAKDAAVRAALD
jgi:hypothetical protein